MCLLVFLFTHVRSLGKPKNRTAAFTFQRCDKLECRHGEEHVKRAGSCESCMAAMVTCDDFSGQFILCGSSVERCLRCFGKSVKQGHSSLCKNTYMLSVQCPKPLVIRNERAIYDGTASEPSHPLRLNYRCCRLAKQGKTGRNRNGQPPRSSFFRGFA